MGPSIAPQTADQKAFSSFRSNDGLTVFSQRRHFLFATSELRHDAPESMQLNTPDEHRAASDGDCHLKYVVNTKRKDIAMLYVFNSANRVQIAWNNEVPGQQPSKKRRNGMLKSFIRSLSAR